MAIFRGEKAVAATPLDYPDRATHLNNLGSTLSSKYGCTGAQDDLELAILRFEQALVATPLDHPYRANRLNNTGLELGRRFRKTNNRHDYERAIQYFKESIELPSAPPASRIVAAMCAIPFLVTGNKWVELSEITEAAITIVPHVSLRPLDQNGLQHIMTDFSGLASSAATAALQAGKSASHAARLLELGRGVIANLQCETRTELSDLREQHPSEAEEFERLCDQLDLTNALHQVPSRRNAVSRGLDKAIQKLKIRKRMVTGWICPLPIGRESIWTVFPNSFSKKFPSPTICTGSKQRISETRPPYSLFMLGWSFHWPMPCLNPSLLVPRWYLTTLARVVVLPCSSETEET
jgi:tetratricopeptide (TPR) repeat protein